MVLWFPSVCSVVFPGSKWMSFCWDAVLLGSQFT